jgi:hypothetical protein
MRRLEKVILKNVLLDEDIDSTLNKTRSVSDCERSCFEKQKNECAANISCSFLCKSQDLCDEK